MGGNFCGFRRRPTPKRSIKQDIGNEKHGPATSVMKFMKPRSLWAAIRVNYRQETQAEVQLCKNNFEVLTLQDWIMSSPGFTTETNSITSGGEHRQSSRKIHPSFDQDLKEELLLKPDKKVSMKTAEAQKRKKKVSFRSPEVADIFMLDHSPQIIYMV